MEYPIFLIYQKLTVQDFNFRLFGILTVSTLRFDEFPSGYLIFYSNLSGVGVHYHGLDHIGNTGFPGIRSLKNQNFRILFLFHLFGTDLQTEI